MKTKTYSISAVAEELQISRATVANCLKRGLLPNARKSGPFSKSRWRIPAGDLETLRRLIDENQGGGG